MAHKFETKRNNRGAYRASDGSEITDYEKYVRYEELLQQGKIGLGGKTAWLFVLLLLGIVWWW